MATADNGEPLGGIERVEELIRRSESLTDPAARECVREIVRTLLDFHGAGLAKILDRVGGAGEPGREILSSLARDGLVSSLMLLYGLHPLPIEERVRAALEKLRARLRKEGVEVDLLGVEGDVVWLCVEGDADVWAIQQAVYTAAPDASSVEVTTAKGNGKAPRVPLPVRHGS